MSMSMCIADDKHFPRNIAATSMHSLAPAYESLGDILGTVVAGLSGHPYAPARCNVIFGLTVPVV